MLRWLYHISISRLSSLRLALAYCHHTEGHQNAREAWRSHMQDDGTSRRKAPGRHSFPRSSVVDLLWFLT